MEKTTMLKKTGGATIAVLVMVIALSCIVVPVAADENDTFLIIYAIGDNLENQTKKFASGNIGDLVNTWDTKSGKVLMFYGASNDGNPGWSKNEISIADYENLKKDYDEDKVIGSSSATQGVTPYRLGTLQNKPISKEGLTAALQYANEYAKTNGLSNAHRYIIFWGHGSGYSGYSGLKNAEISQALSTSDKNFDIIIFDSCLMANLEAAYALKQNGKYLLGSEEEEPGKGQDYRYLSKALSPSSSKNQKNIASTIMEGYITSEEQTNPDAWKTLSLLDLNKVDPVVSKVDTLGKWLGEAFNANAKQTVSDLAYAWEKADRFSNKNHTVDLYTYAKAIAGLAKSESSLKNAANEAADSVQTLAVLNRVTPQHANAKGVSIASVSSIPAVDSAVTLTNQEWAKFLTAYINYLDEAQKAKQNTKFSYASNAPDAQTEDSKASQSLSPGTLTITDDAGLTVVYVDYLNREGDKYYIVSQDLATQGLKTIEDEYWAYAPNGEYTVETDWDGTAYVLENAAASVPVTMLYDGRFTNEGINYTIFTIEGDFTRTVDGEEVTLPSYLTALIDLESGKVYDLYVTSGSPDDADSCCSDEWSDEDILSGDRFTPKLDYLTDDSDTVLSETSTKTFVFSNDPVSELKKKTLNEDDCFWEYEITTILADEDDKPFLLDTDKITNGVVTFPSASSAESPAPVIGLIIGLGAAVLFLRKRA